MSGHSKWANIKHKKGAADAKRGKIFSKIAKEIIIVVGQSGKDISSNPALRTLIQKARAVNMPADNIDRAIKRGSGELQGARMEEVMFEGFAAGGVALIVQALTDNRNRTVAEVRHVFTKHSANLAGQGQVMRTFQRKGQILVPVQGVDEDKLMELVLEAGAEDMSRDGDVFEILTDPASYPAVAEAISKAGVATTSSEVTLLPLNWTPVTDKDKAASLLRFIEELEELDDVQNVYSNFDMDPALLDALSKA